MKCVRIRKEKSWYAIATQKEHRPTISTGLTPSRNSRTTSVTSNSPIDNFTILPRASPLHCALAAHHNHNALKTNPPCPSSHPLFAHDTASCSHPTNYITIAITADSTDTTTAAVILQYPPQPNTARAILTQCFPEPQSGWLKTIAGSCDTADTGHEGAEFGEEAV
jgi:hypothetical protein